MGRCASNHSTHVELVQTASPSCSTKCCAGDRTTLRRAQLAEPIVHAAAFSTPHGAGVACLTYTGNLLVYSLPGLEPLLVCPDWVSIPSPILV